MIHTYKDFNTHKIYPFRFRLTKTATFREWIFTFYLKIFTLLLILYFLKRKLFCNFCSSKNLSINFIIIMSCREHGYPCSSLTTFPYRSSPLAGLQGYIPYPHIATVCMFELVVLLLLGHMWGSIGVHHLWARPCFSSSVLHVCFVMGGRWPYS